MREKEFLDFNIDNIFINLYQTEDHLRRLNSVNNEEGHASCVFKHLSFVSGELGEAISHSSVVRPELTPIFQQLMKEVDNLRHKLSDLSVDQAIKKVRNIRKVIEKLNPKYDTEKCKACGAVEAMLTQKIENNGNLFKSGNPKNINSKKIVKGESMDRKEITTIVASQFVGKGVQEFTKYIDDTMGKTGAPLFERPSTWINIVGGVGGVLAGLYLFERNPELKLASVVVGSNLLTKLVDYGREYAGVGSLAVMRPIAPAHVQGFVDREEITGRPISLVNVD